MSPSSPAGEPASGPAAVAAPPAPAGCLSLEEVRARAARAREAQAVWRRYTITQRVERLRGFWRELQAAKPRLLEVVRRETGKPTVEIEVMELCGVELILKHFTRNAHRILKDQAAPRPWILFNKKAYVRYVPRGLVALVTPWNYPLLIPLGDMIPALIAGNAVLLKPSEWTTDTALLLESVFKTTGLFPEGLLSVATGDGSIGSEVIALADMVLFTGSTRTGRVVARAAAERLIPCVLELGGKHPMIVLKDAALERAAKAAVWGRFANCGQTCVGVERVYVEAEAYDRFTELVAREMATLRQSLAPGYDVDLGRLIFPRQLETVLAHLEDARARGARVSGGEIVDRERLLLSPALVLDARQEMKVMREETFGPVLPVMRVGGAEEAVRLANDSPLGLAASIWSRDLPRAEALGAHLEAGLIGVNDLMGHYAICSLPFGGMKESGLGRRHSDEGLRMFSHQQSVLVHEWPANAPELWWFPYSELKAKLVSYLSRLS
ncbi:MAG: aldehyde dehydrogenase family protein [Elusimicrobia bacterium]|nr:aldehyde dehydrogenase family protein [Elusimicrobiota bacterium]